MFLFKKKSAQGETQNLSEGELKERLFFHDIINQTHGLLLYFSQKEMSDESLCPEEVKMIASEIKTLQSLIRDHFNYKHKNLGQTYDWVPFSYLQFSFSYLKMTYLSDKDVTISFKNDGAGELEEVYYPAFYRIMNNLIKNIAESKSQKVEFLFHLQRQGLFIETKNSMNSGMEKSVPDHLSRVILSESSPQIMGLGLESIHHLASENGGDFTFEIIDGQWINRIFLPVRASKLEKIPA